jgi:hypothetical protein
MKHAPLLRGVCFLLRKIKMFMAALLLQYYSEAKSIMPS